MMAHFVKLHTPLRAVPKYPTTMAQEERFKALGWNEASARNLWHLWNDPNFISSQERISLDVLEPFDEWEEFALFGCHYFLLVASTTTTTTSGWEFCKEDRPSLGNEFLNPDITHSVRLEMRYAENPKTQGCRRFGAVLPLKSSIRIQGRVGIFGGMGLNTRMNSYDIYATDLSEGMTSNHQATSIFPSSRMCHTITDIGEAGALLVGGRTSPDNALADCWLYHKWLDTWERVEDLPFPQYRHAAANLGKGYVLVAPGKTNSRNISTNFYIWSRTLGWVNCVQGLGEKLLPAYGVTFTVFDKPIDASASRFGLLAGGMSEDGMFLEDIWEWELRNMLSQASTPG
jgi:tRNA wybutosine-synthesizing protein 4